MPVAIEPVLNLPGREVEETGQALLDHKPLMGVRFGLQLHAPLRRFTYAALDPPETIEAGQHADFVSWLQRPIQWRDGPSARAMTALMPQHIHPVAVLDPGDGQPA